MSDAPPAILPPPPLVAVAGWVLPGSGYWLIGQRGRADAIGLTILALFIFGVLIGGIRVVEAPDLAGPGTFLARILQKPWFLGQVLTGPIGIIAAWLSSAAAHSEAYKLVQAKARLAEIGTLYTAVAGMLNLLAIIDSSHRSANHGNR
jgi:hypothetical protein